MAIKEKAQSEAAIEEWKFRMSRWWFVMVFADI